MNHITTREVDALTRLHAFLKQIPETYSEELGAKAPGWRKEIQELYTHVTTSIETSTLGEQVRAPCGRLAMSYVHENLMWEGVWTFPDGSTATVSASEGMYCINTSGKDGKDTDAFHTVAAQLFGDTYTPYRLTLIDLIESVRGEVALLVNNIRLPHDTARTNMCNEVLQDLAYYRMYLKAFMETTDPNAIQGLQHLFHARNPGEVYTPDIAHSEIKSVQAACM